PACGAASLKAGVAARGGAGRAPRGGEQARRGTRSPPRRGRPASARRGDRLRQRRSARAGGRPARRCRSAAPGFRGLGPPGGLAFRLTFAGRRQDSTGGRQERADDLPPLGRVDTSIDVPRAAGEVACHDCAQVQLLPPLGLHAVARCWRCDAVLDVREPSDSTPLALALAGVLCGLVANAFPIIEVSLAGRHRSNLLISGPRVLTSENFGELGLLVATFSIVIPLLWLGAVSYVLFHVWAGKRVRALGPLFRLAERLRPWAVLDAYVIGGYVAVTRLEELGRVSIGIGGRGAGGGAART